MRRFRFHIGTLVILVLLLGFGFAALRESNETWDSSIFSLRESPQNSLGMIRVFCFTPLRCGFGFESWSQGGDDESSHGRGDCVVQGCRPEVDRTQAQGVPGPGDLGLLGR